MYKMNKYLLIGKLTSFGQQLKWEIDKWNYTSGLRYWFSAYFIIKVHFALWSMFHINFIFQQQLILFECHVIFTYTIKKFLAVVKNNFIESCVNKNVIFLNSVKLKFKKFTNLYKYTRPTNGFYKNIRKLKNRNDVKLCVMEKQKCDLILWNRTLFVLLLLKV